MTVAQSQCDFLRIDQSLGWQEKENEEELYLSMGLVTKNYTNKLGSLSKLRTWYLVKKNEKAGGLDNETSQTKR